MGKERERGEKGKRGWHKNFNINPKWNFEQRKLPSEQLIYVCASVCLRSLHEFDAVEWKKFERVRKKMK